MRTLTMAGWRGGFGLGRVPLAWSRRAVGSVPGLLRSFWTVPAAAAAIGWTLRTTMPMGASPGSYVASLLGIVAPTSLTFPCWLHGVGASLRRRSRPPVAH